MLETILGDVLVHDGTGTAGYYSPPFGKGGDAAVFSVEVTHRNGTPTLVFAVEHKTPEDTSWSGAGSTSMSSTGVATAAEGSWVFVADRNFASESYDYWVEYDSCRRPGGVPDGPTTPPCSDVVVTGGVNGPLVTTRGAWRERRTFARPR